MLDKLTETLDYQGKALVLRAERQRTIASNIANADTPGYQARDFDFKTAMREATGQNLSPMAQPTIGTNAAGQELTAVNGATDPRHIPLRNVGEDSSGELGYRNQVQPSMDNNTVDMDSERAAYMDNTIHYESTLRFINGYTRTITSAITGQ
jgi:flagellar basal-body rod protein FlgB